MAATQAQAGEVPLTAAAVTLMVGSSTLCWARTLLRCRQALARRPEAREGQESPLPT